MTGMTWLHLSDWHQAEKKFNRKVVCDALIKDIKARGNINPNLSKIDFIVFSGDAANAGQPDEYKKATEDLFNPLLEACELGQDRLFIVPGNHDLDRDLIPAALDKPLNSNEEVEPWWGEEKKRMQLSQPFQAFNRFLTECTGQKPPDYCSVASFVIDGKKIELLGINSAWMCARHKDEAGEVSDQGYLCIGEPQIYESLEKISGSDIKIAVLHHSLDWLTPFDSSRNEVHLKGKCNFILHGHAHKPGASAIRDNFGYYITIPAGACYDRSMPSNSDYTYSYNYVHLDFDADKGFVFLRRWSDLNRIWRKDDETFPPNGQFNFSISGSDKPPIPSQIPPPPRDFKGREEEIADILFNFEKGATITGLRGMGGVGKTALALVLADKIKSQFPDGQIFVDMRGTSNNPELPPVTPAEAMAQVVRAYNPADRLPENSNELRGLYHSILAGKRALLLLDNAANGEQVEPLFPPAGCAVLITSRIRFALPGLAGRDLDILPKDKACELLLEIAPRIGNRAEELAKRCGYLPIALRNAASALAEKRDLSVPEYEKRLNDKVALLKLVKGSFSLSYDLLTPGRKKQWRRLSVFPEDFDRNAATAVLKMAPGPSAEALNDLVRWSLVDFAAIPDSEEGRYKLHDLARLFAESCLDGDELADAQQKHAKYYSKVLSQAENFYEKGGTNLLAGLKLFDREWANIKIGQARVKNIIQISRKLDKSDLKSVLQLASSYACGGGNVLDLRLHPSDKIGWLETGLKAAKMMGDRGAESAHLGNLGGTYSVLGETRKAIGYQERALKISRKIGDRRGEEADLCNLGNRYSDLGETCIAVGYYEQALAIAREIGDRRGEGANLGNLGLAYAALGGIRKAIEYYEQALSISRESGDRRGEGSRLSNLGSAYFDLGETRKAIEYHEQSLKISREIGDRRGEGTDLSNLGLAYIVLGETRKAIDNNEVALAIAREIGDRRGEVARLGNLGLAYAGLGETRKAIEYHEQALAIAREIEDKQNEGECLCNLVKAYLDLNETDKAIEYCTESLDIVRKIDYRKIEGDALCTLGKAYSNLGEIDKAIDHCDQALEIFKKMEYRRGEGEALFTKSLALDKLDRRTEAAVLATEALQIFSQIESPLAEKVRRKLAEWAVGN
jgi:tetratricopeptide (TPR) repeat protein/predicted phosphodiesterase